MASKGPLKAVDVSHLSSYEEEWVALTTDWKVVAHSAKLVDLRRRLGAESASYSFFFVPSFKVGYSLLCRI